MRKKLLFVALLSVMATTFAQEKIKDVSLKGKTKCQALTPYFL